MSSPSALFAALVIGAVLFFTWSCYRRFSLVAIGVPEDRTSAVWRRLGAMLLYAFGQKRVISRPFGFNHFVIFWAFMILLVANGEFILHGIWPAISLERLPRGLYHGLLLLIDCVSLLALAGVGVAAVRRTIAPPFPRARTVEAYFILGLIALLMLAYFGITGARLAAAEPALQAELRPWVPVSGLAAALVSPPANSLVHAICWWIHAVVLLVFMCFLPYSKHMHILTAIPNCFFRRFEKPNTQPRETFAAGRTYGVERVDQFTWKDLFDAYSCTECGRCRNACPATATGKPLNPQQVIHDLKVNLLASGPAVRQGRAPVQALIGPEAEGTIAEDAIWSCTTCGACMEACPVFIEQMPKLIDLRRNLVESRARFPEELLNLFENMEQRSNPWGIAPADRAKWAATMDVKPFESGKTEYLFYVGCAGSFDARNRHVTVALATVLNAAGVSWGILGREETCCGESLRRLGNEYAFEQLAAGNVKTLQYRGVKKIITQCPHCFSALRNDYRQYGLDVEVVHHSELIRDLLAAGRLKLDHRVTDLGTLVIHDSCYLGRHNDIYEAPRAALQAATGAAPGELGRHHGHSFCCGAGGGRMWMEERLGTRINLNRVAEAIQAGADTICVSCPYCMTMFEDGLKDAGSGQTRVRDVAEVVAEALRTDRKDGRPGGWGGQGHTQG